jgi:hypothetical protein
MAACNRSSTRAARSPGSERIDFDRDALTREVVHDIHRTDAAAIGERVDGKVRGPAVEALRGERRRNPLGARQPLASAPPRLQAGGLVDAMDALVIDAQSLSLEHDVQPSVAETGADRRVRLEAFQHGGICQVGLSLSSLSPMLIAQQTSNRNIARGRDSLRSRRFLGLTNTCFLFRQMMMVNE